MWEPPNASNIAVFFHTFYGLDDGYSIDRFTPERREPKNSRETIVERDVIWNETIENATNSWAKREYKRSQEKGFQTIDISDIDHERAEQMEEIHQTLVAAKVKRFTFSDTSNHCQPKLKFFTDRGWKIKGMIDLHDPTNVFDREPKPAVLFVRK